MKFALMSLVLIMASGCVATGAKYQQREFVSGAQSKVIFFRPNNFMGGGAKLAIYDGQELLYKIKNGQFIVHNASLGAKVFTTKTMGKDAPLSLNIEPGEHYYVRVGIHAGAMLNTIYMTRVYEDEALVELESCCRSGD